MGNAKQLLLIAGEDAQDDFAFSAGTVAISLQRAPQREGPGEDAILLTEVDAERGVIAVADGAGGTPSGERAAKLALERLDQSVRSAVDAGRELRDGILDGFENANQAVTGLGVGAATTLVAVELSSRNMRCYHVGDSEVLVVGQRGKVKWQTVAHSPAGHGVEAGLLDEEEALHHDERHFLTNAVGNADMRIDIGPTVQLAAFDTVCIASDGMFDNLRSEEIADIIRAGPLDRAQAALRAACAERMAEATDAHPGKPDDLGFALFRLRR